MKVKDFFKAVHGSENLRKDAMDKEVDLRLYNKEGVRITSDIDITDCSYMFAPWVDNGRGTLVIEAKLKH